MPPRKIHVDEVLVRHRAGAHLVVARGQKLDHAVPERLVLRLQIAQAQVLEHGDRLLQAFARLGQHTLTAEILRRKGLRVDLVHRARRVRRRADLIRVELLPPVQRGGQIDRDENLPDEFPVVAAGRAQPLREAEVVFAEDERAVRLGVAVHAVPAVHRVARAAHRIFKIHDMGPFDLNHKAFPSRLFVVFRSRIDRKRAVQLLTEHDARELVREGHRRHRNALAARLDGFVQAVRGADHERKAARASHSRH